MKEVTIKNVKCKTGGLIPRKGDARGMHKGWNFTLNRESMSFDSRNWKGLRVYMMKDLRITLEVLQGEKVIFKVLKNRNFDKGNMTTKLLKMEAARDEVYQVWWYSDSNAFVILRVQDARTRSGPMDQRHGGSNQKMDDNNPGMDKKGMQPDVTYMEQPERVVDQKGTSA
ncbi:hypothetical protein AgCh_000719 [Apium graveolens]